MSAGVALRTISTNEGFRTNSGVNPAMEPKLGVLSKKDAEALEQRGNQYLKNMESLNTDLASRNSSLNGLQDRKVDLHQRKDELKGGIHEREAKIQQLESGLVKIQTGLHGMATNALTRVFIASFSPSSDELNKLSEEGQKELRLQAAEKCRKAVEPFLNESEKANINNLYILHDKKECLRLTAPLANTILAIYQRNSCSSPNFYNFQDEIDPASLRQLLSNNKITQVTFHESVKNDAILKAVVMDVKKTHHDFKIGFVKA